MKFLQTVRNVLVPVGLATFPFLASAQGLVPPPNFAGTFGGELIPGIQIVVNWFLLLTSLVAVVVIVYGGLRYILSRGDEDAAGEAKMTILYAVIGLIVIGLSAAIIRFTIQAFVR